MRTLRDKRVSVTGGAGFLGPHLFEELPINDGRSSRLRLYPRDGTGKGAYLRHSGI